MTFSKSSLISVAALVITFWFSLQPVLDPDTGWHLATGRYIIQNAHIPTTDIFSFSLPDHPYISHSWLFDTFLYGIYAVSGAVGMSIVYAAVTTLSIYALGKTAQAWYKIPSYLYIYFPVIATFAHEIIGQRPQAITVLGISLMMFLLTRPHRKNEIRLFTLLFVSWANLHGGVVLGVGLLAMVAILTIISHPSTATVGRYAKILVIAVCGSLLNPHIYTIYTFAIKMITNQTSFMFNTDWVPLFSTGLGEQTMLLRLIIAAIFVVASIDNPQPKIARLMTAGLFVASLKSLRFLVPLFAVGTPLVINTLDKLSRQKLWILPIVLIGMVSTNPVLINKANVTCHLESACFAKAASVPYETIKYLQESKATGNIFNFYTWGGLLDWQLPTMKVFIDGRMDNFFLPSGQSFLNEFVAIHHQEIDWYEKLMQYRPNWVLIPRKLDRSHSNADYLRMANNCDGRSKRVIEGSYLTSSRFHHMMDSDGTVPSVLIVERG